MVKPTISLIVAVAKNGTIGKNNALPWDLPSDLAFFKKHTIQKPIIMGSKTAESLGKFLPNRKNIIITRGTENGIEKNGIHYFNRLEDAIEAYREEPEIMIIGGASIYKECLKKMNRLYLTTVQEDIEGDTCFSEVFDLPFNQAKLVFSENHNTDDKHAYPFRFEIWDFNKA